LTRSYSGTAQILNGSVSRTVNLLTRSYAGTAQIFSGVVVGSTGAPSIYDYAASGLLTLSGAISRVASRFISKAGALTMSGTFTRSWNRPRAYAGTFVFGGNVVYEKVIEILYMGIKNP